ncbi:MAG: ABC transporter permease [bacterium]|nr:ABC transporter permease [bacterium]
MSAAGTVSGEKLIFGVPAKNIPWERLILIGAFATLLIFYTIATDNFLTLENFINVVRRDAWLFFLAYAQTIVIISGGFDLSQGSIMSIVSVIGWSAMLHFGFVGGLVTGLAVGLACGLINGYFIGVLRVYPFIATLGMLFVGSGVAQLWTGGLQMGGAREGATLPAHVEALYVSLSKGSLGSVPLPFVWILLVLGASWYLLKHTRFGTHVYALGGSEQTAISAGISFSRMKIAIFGLSGFLCALSGLLLSANVSAAGEPRLGGGDQLLQSIGATIIGGTHIFGGRGGVLGTTLGVFLIIFLVNGLNIMGIDTYRQQIIVGLVILASIWVSTLREQKH